MNDKNKTRQGAGSNIHIGQVNASDSANVNIAHEINQTLNNRQQTSVTKNEFINILEHINQSVQKSGLDPDTQAAIKNDLKAVATQSQKPEPQKGLILNRLKSAMELLITTGGAVSAAQTILPLLQKAFEMAKSLF